MNNILCIDMRESAHADSYFFTYYVYDASSGEAYWDKACVSSTEDLMSELQNLQSVVSEGCDNLIMYKVSSSALADSLLGEYVPTLSEYLYGKALSLYDMISLDFVDESATTYFEMLDKIVRFNRGALLHDDTPPTKIVSLHSERVLDGAVSVSYGIGDLRRVEMQTIAQSSIAIEEFDDGYMQIRRFFKRLNGRISALGYCKTDIRYMHFSHKCLSEFKCMLDMYGVSGYQFVENPIILEDVLSSVNGIEITGYTQFIGVFRGICQISFHCPALSILKCLISAKDMLRLNFVNGNLVSGAQRFIKDYSESLLDTDALRGVSYGIILDCEGTSEGQCSELGGIIFKKFNGVLYKAETFNITPLDFSEGVADIFEQYERIMGRYIPGSGINVLVYGPNDKRMILNSLSGNKAKGLRRKVDKMLHFTDCQDFICEFVDCDTHGRKLADVACALGVRVVHPKHNALNDSKTLYNILSEILDKYGEFPL